MDRISNLPDEIICHIGSFLSAKEAAFTTVLSKRWHNLFTIVPDLHFDCSVKDGESLCDFADRVMALPASSRVNKFSLKWWFDEDTESAQFDEDTEPKDTEPAQFDEDTERAQFDQINRCLRDVLKRGVGDLYLWVNGKQGYTLPFEVFTCQTVTKLSLGSSFVIDILPENALLPALKTLSLYYIRFYEFGRCAFKTLLAASPVLEELTVCGVNWELWKWSRTVSSSSLKRLTIMRKGWDSFDDSDFKSISFDTPSLAYLYYSDYVPKEYLSVNLDSLVETKLYLCPEENYMWGEGDEKRFNPMNLLHGLKNVETLNLYTIMTAKMFYVFREALPVFEKLSHLTVNLSNFCWSSMPMLIKKAPNLKTLNINGPLHYESYYRCAGDIVCECVAEYSFLVSCPLEVLKITEYYGCFRELMQMKHFLEKLSFLELVEIHSQATGERKLKLIADLQRLPRASSKCKFESVVKLKLGSGFVIDILPKNAFLPALKTLLLDSVRFEFDNTGGCSFTRLLSACPVLEELVIDGHNCEDWKWSRIVSSQILKRLTIRREEWVHNGNSFEPFSLYTPSLEYFEYFDVLRDRYPVVYLNSLVEAKLELPPLYIGESYDVRNLIKGLKNIQILRLGAVDTMQLFWAFREAVPVFENLFHLSVSTDPAICWDALYILLKSSPNLKTLTIEALHYYQDYHLTSVCQCLEGYSYFLSCHIEILKITHFSGQIGEMVQIKHVLENFLCLVLLEVHVEEKRVDNKLQILADLLMLPRASSKCKVQVKFV